MRITLPNLKFRVDFLRIGRFDCPAVRLHIRSKIHQSKDTCPDVRGAVWRDGCLESSLAKLK